MASLIEGYNYDVFISYRQKDNKYDGWVTAFVENLKLELEATFKEDISVYFDKNPDDGLLESHDVGDSLREKLKCVVFIPVLSQTYCDPKSYAFENEFKRFVAQSSNDKTGLKVNLPNGNVSSRVLPVRINELGSEDVKLVESIIGSQLRGIDFIYRSPGVNRPLRQVEDHPQDNLNKTFYRDQINKVARTIKEIIISIKGDTMNEVPPARSARDEGPEPGKRKFLPLKIAAFIAISAIISLVVFIPGRPDGPEILDRAISYHDFYSNWENFEGRLHLITLFSTGSLSEEVIEIRTKENYYKCISISSGSKDTVIKGIISGRCFRQINRDMNPDQDLIKEHRLDSLRIDDFRQHHYFHFGGVMFLKNSGMMLDKKVVKTTFSGRKCLMISFSSDSLSNTAHYFNNSQWNVYIDPDDYSVIGYNANGGFYVNEHIVVWQGELIHNLIKVPMFKFYYNSTNDIMLVDLFHEEDQK